MPAEAAATTMPSAAGTQGSNAAHRRSTSTQSDGKPQPTFLRSLSTVKSMPSISMAGKLHSHEEAHPTVSPGTYCLPRTEKTSKHRKAPSFGFGDAPRRERHVARQVPGPGSYDAKDNRYPTAKKASFGTSPARGRPLPVRRYGPGPGAYRLKSIGDDCPVVRFQGRARDPEPASKSLPGPGAYNPSASTSWLHEGTSKFKSATKVGFGTSGRDPLEGKSEDVPGPGTYAPQECVPMGEGSAKFSFQTRRQQHYLEEFLAPGPGEYPIASSFGYTSTFVPRPTPGATAGGDATSRPDASQ